MADFEKKHPGIAAQKLWKLFEEKAVEQGLGRDFVSAVGEVCAIGLNLSKYIVRFFPTFTLHDETHSVNVCQWMWVLLGEEGRKKLTPHEAALLLMAACCHDIGMAVSPEQEEQMRLRTYPGWDDYFRQNLKDDEEYEEKKVISDRMLRNFVRMRHHERIGENLRESDWPDDLFDEELDWELLLALCRSHGVELEGAELTCRGELYDLRMCAALLRLADLLDFDAGRAPEVLFRQMGLDRPRDAESWRSAEEHQKNRTGIFREKFVNGRIRYIAQYDNPGVEQEIRKYLDWVDQELTKCRNCLSQSERWKNLDLPYKVDDEKVKRKGYAAGKFRMTMDQDKVIDLLTGENLYSDAGVFVRELLQNSIDAVLMRAKQDPNFSPEDGLIQIDTWMDEEANTWFRIRDNGTGMNEHIIQNHFLKVGNSYYTSEEFKYANRHAPKGSYTAISRFGIGILSCFMGDKEHTQLKVSTKRFDENGKSGIRLDVTGLHGYYFLCKEKKHPASEPWFPKMPSINEEDRGYREAPGTTICVNTNLLRMGELRSFREILDKYVQFPEVRVTYNGPEGYKEYPTQQELMEAVYALNPGGVVKEHVHEIPDEIFNRIKRVYPVHTWKEKPAIIFRYVPTDLSTDTEKMTGVMVQVETYPCKDDVYLGLKLKDNEIDFKVGIYDTKFCHYEDRFSVAISGTDTILHPDEQKLWDMCWTRGYFADDKQCRISHNGIWINTVNWYQRMADCQFGLVLLRGDFLPQLNMARDEIITMPLELECCFTRIPGLRLWQSQEGAYENILLATEKELCGILDKHPYWQELLGKESCLNIHCGKRLQKITFDNNWKLGLWLAYWKRKCRVRINRMEYYVEEEKAPDEEITEFPVTMFIRSEEEMPILRQKQAHYANYNRNHPFSLWLIKNRNSLVKEVPAIYDKLIRTMMLKHDAEEIRNTLNGIIKILRIRPGNPFHVPEDLVLTEADFEANN